MFELTAKSKTSVDIRMYGSISQWGKVNAEAFAQSLRQAEDDGYSTINLRVNSPGGSIFEGLAIMALIKSSPLDVDMYIDGMAASMMSVVSTACRKVYMARGARIMIHQGAGGVYGSAQYIKDYAALLESLNESLAEAYASKTGKEKDWILENWMGENKDTWFNYKAAEKAKLIDGESDMKIQSPKEEEGSASMQEMAAHYNEQLQNSEDTMKELLIKRYGLDASATEEEIMAAIEAAEKKSGEQTPDLASAESVDALMTIAETAGLVTDDNKAQVKAMAQKAGVKETAEFLKTLKPAAQSSSDDGQRLSDAIKEIVDGIKPEGNKEKKFEDYSPEELDALEKKDPEAFEKLFKASAMGKVNVTPEG